MPDCRHFEICEIPSLSDNNFCILHAERKGVNDFNFALADYLKTRADFRRCFFPNGCNFTAKGKTFPTLANFEDATFEEHLNLDGANLPYGLRLSTKKLAAVTLADATIDGDVSLSQGPAFFGLIAKTCLVLSSAVLRPSETEA